MKEVECTVSNLTYLEDKAYYIVVENESNTKHFIPKEQVEIFDNIDLKKTHTFLKEYDPKVDKTFLYLLSPNYKIGQEKLFEIKGKTEIDKKVYFKVKSEYKKDLIVQALKWQENFSSVKCKVIGYKRGIPKLRNIDLSNKNWEIGKTYFFELQEYGYCEDRKGVKFPTVIVKIDSTNHQHVRAYCWHRTDLWSYKDIECKVTGLTKEGLPKLKIIDSRHPIYSLNTTYKFVITGFADKILTSGNIIRIIKLKDHTNCHYEVASLPHQEEYLEIGMEIECEVEAINTNLHLKQIHKDPFFFTFESICENKEYKKVFFDRYLNDENNSNLKLKSQYTQKSAFWIFTFCNHIIPQIKSDLSQRKDYRRLIEIINLHSKIEEWILKNGILKALRNEQERKHTKNKILYILNANKTETYSVSSLSKIDNDDFFKKQMSSINFLELYFYIKHADFSAIDEIKIANIINNNIINPEPNLNEIKKILKAINKNKKHIQSQVNHGDFFILANTGEITNKTSFKKYINWLYIELCFANLLPQNNKSKILLAQLYRYYSLVIPDNETKKKLLLNSFFVLNSDSKIINNLKIHQGELTIDLDNLPDNPNKTEEIQSNLQVHTAEIKERHYQGFVATIGKTNGFLPTQNITDSNLKFLRSNKIYWLTNVAITLYSKNFNYFIAKQLDNSSPEYYSENKNKHYLPTSGDVLNAVVRNINTEFGIFATTEYGDGLIQIKNISENLSENLNYLKKFKIGDKLRAYVLTSETGRIGLSLKHLISTEHENYYYQLIYSETIKSEDDTAEDLSDFDLDFDQEIEKGHIFEQYASIQNTIQEKIEYLKFAKIFFSNTKNARSYLLNIYIDYFESLIMLDQLLENYSFTEYENFRNDILEIKSRVHLKTLENFPESKNLLFFIDILNLFNSKKESDLETLFNLTKFHIEQNDFLLKTVAKNTLANNLIVSELENTNTEEINNFTFKNLRRIRQYISQGVLSVEETIEDKLAKELAEKRSYWIGRIKEEEGEALEFKSTFITPVSSKDKDNIVDNLRKQIKNTNNEEKKKNIELKINELRNENNIQKAIIHSALKTICAFANTNGGTLLLGVSDDKKIFGLEQDYNYFKQNNGRDEFGKFFDSTIKDYFGESFSPTILDKEFLKFKEGDILVVKVKKSSEEVFLLKNEKGEKDECFYVRHLSSSEKLKGRELLKYARNNFKK